jgi:hypothetical protein
MTKKGQIRISFGVIFSIFLIIVFIFFAFKVIDSFVDLNKCTELGSFYDDFQDAIDQARESHSTNQPYDLSLGSTVDKICFVDLNSTGKGDESFPNSYSEGDNFFVLFNDGGCEQLSNFEFNNINITEITKDSNPNCFENENEITIIKSVYSRLVTVE